MKKIAKLIVLFITIIMLVMAASHCRAKTEAYRDSLLGPFTSGATFTVLDPNYAFGGTINSTMNTVALRTLDNVKAASGSSYTASITITYYTYASPATPVVVNTTLTVNYNNTGPYKGLDVYTFSGAYKIQVTFNSATGSPNAGTVQLSSEVVIDRIYPFNAALAVAPSYELANNKKQMLVTWSPMQGADEYDVEWTTINDGNNEWAYINAHKGTPGYSGFTDTLNSVFRSNASRFTLSDTAVSIALMSTDSLLLVRIRQIQYNANGVRQAGNWDYSNSTAYAIFTVNWDEPGQNWQYSAAFAEQAKKKEVTSYFDGTLRGRQTVTLDNSDNVALAQENVYDYFGRPAASVLPAPYKEPTVSPYLHYIPNFNTSKVDSPYRYKNIIGSTPLTCTVNPDSLSTDSGASRYYSARNQFITQNLSNPYIPDAAGFPLSVTQYTPDNTGRIRSQGGVGPVFQPGTHGAVSGKLTQYFYAKPEQWELDQLFANDVGYAEHYLKNMVVDPNGQVSVSYLNASGKIIATALAGPAPSTLDTLTSFTRPQVTTTQLLKPSQFVYSATALSLNANTTFLASVIGNTDSLIFNIQKLINTYPGSFTLCSNCYYQMTAQVSDACGNVVDSIRTPVVVGSAVANCTATGMFQDTLVVPINTLGEYNVSIQFAYNSNVIQAYSDTFVNRAIDTGYLQSQFDYIKNRYLDSLNLASCYADCHTCQTALGTQSAFFSMLQTEFVTTLGVDTTNESGTGFSTWANALYTQLKDSCNAKQATCTYASPCAGEESLMEGDVSPGGQYALFADSLGTPLQPGANVLTDTTSGATVPNWRIAFPIKSPTDSTYVANEITQPDGSVTSPNSSSFTIGQLVQYWNPAWAQYFLKYHPEYCQLKACLNNATYEGWDQMVQQDITTAALVPNIPNGTDTLHYSYTNSATWLVPADPFFKTGAPGHGYVAAMDSDLNYYSQRVLNISGGTVPNKNLMQFVDYKLYCQDNTGNMNLYPHPDSTWFCTPNNSCRVTNREWALYQQYYFQAKQKYYNLITADSCSASGACPIGQALNPLPVYNCPMPGDFSVQLNNDTTVTPCSGTQTVAITHNPGSLSSSLLVSLYYPPNGDTGLDTTVNFSAGDSREIICVPNDIAVNQIKVHRVYCNGLPQYGNDTTWVVHVTDSLGGSLPPYCTGQVVRTTSVTLTDGAGTPVTAVNPITVYLKYSSQACSGPPDTSVIVVFIDPGSSTATPVKYLSSFTCPCAEGAVSTLLCVDSLSNASRVTGLGTCTGYHYHNPQPPAPTHCLMALEVKTPRFPSIDYIPAGVDGTITTPSQLTAPMTQAVVTQAGDMCAGQATAWIGSLQAGLTAIHATPTTIQNLQNALISICSAGGDQNHPMGASSLPPGASGTYSNFGAAIKAIVLSGHNFTTQINPWLIDSPNPYNVPQTATLQTIGNSNPAICGVLAHVDSLATAAGQTPYNYMVSNYGAAMTLSQADLDTLTNSCSNCRFLLANDITLPVFLTPGPAGCIVPSAYAAAKDSLNTQFGRTVLPIDTNYSIIKANFLNQYFGFGISIDQYNDYDSLLVHSPSAMLCNVPPYTTTNINPYDCVQNSLSVTVANGLTDWNNYIATNRQAFIANYESTCSLAQATATLKSSEQLYHYTLYYYDQADNLVRTVPPEGVVLINPGRFAYIDRTRDLDTTTNINCTYNGPTTDAVLSRAMDTLSNVLSASQGAVEMWLYNSGTNYYHIIEATPDNKYIFQAGIAGNTLSVDVFPISAPSSTSMKLLPATGHYSADITALQPLNPFALLVFQGDTLGKAPASPQIYLNGMALTVNTNAIPSPVSLSITGGSTSVAVTDSAQDLKHLRLYRHLLSPATIAADAATICFAAADVGYAGWFRFHIPSPGAPTTIDSTTNEIAYYDTYPAHKLLTTYTYNATNQVSLQNSPDGGTNRYWYDLLSRLTVSQNDKQLPGSNYSYTGYDVLGRITEVGQKNQTTLSISTPHYLPADSLSLFYAAGTNSQITDTYYDTPLPTVSGHTDGIPTITTQNNLRKRVAASTYTQTQGSAVLRGTYYTYDIDGNVNSLWQQLDGLYVPSTNAGLKRIDYEYDLISGKVNFVRYQDGQPDAFYYAYQYDADNRITTALAGTRALVDTLTGSFLPASTRKQDAAYYYYLHGPLRRMVLGGDTVSVQGLDYAYTLQGWLKGVNSASGGAAADMYQDGNNTIHVAQDAYAYSLGYYPNDYTPIGGSGSTAFQLQYQQTMGDITGQSLYNGNISNTTLQLNPLTSLVGYTYHYDQLDRVKKMRYYPGISGTAWNRTNISLDYQENVTYDGNGNILTYGRNGDVANTAQNIDSLTYNYNYSGGKLASNKLNYVHDAVASSGYALDLRNQTSTTNYQYDAIGNLLSDAYAGITNTGWTVYNKPDTIYKAAGNIIYTYNNGNRRVSKTYNGLTTWYVRDAQGNVLGIYNNAHSAVNWTEQDLYGSGRLGMWLPDVNLSAGNSLAVWDTTGDKRYELDNHLGNVLVTITDSRIQILSGAGPTARLGYFLPVPVSAQDYYPFGMPEPNRQFIAAGDSAYRYGFNGKENDNEVMGFGNSQDYGERFYDDRIGRFRSVDPITARYPELSSYQFASNTPIQAVDLDGEERESVNAWNQAMFKLRDDALARGDIKGAKAVQAEWNKTTKIALVGDVTIADVILFDGLLSKVATGATFLGAFHDNPSPTPEGRAKQEKDSWRSLAVAGVMYGGGKIFGKAFQIASPLLQSAIEYTSFDGGTTFADYEGKFLGYYSYSNSKGLELDLNIPKELQNKGLGSEIFRNAVNSTKATKFTAKWIFSGNYENGLSVNLQKFYDAIKNHATDEEAAFSTWSGKQAKAAGFNKVSVKRIDGGIEATFTKGP